LLGLLRFDVLCLLAIVPALFLWGKKQPLAAPSSDEKLDAIETLHEAEIVAALPSATNVSRAEASAYVKRNAAVFLSRLLSPDLVAHRRRYLCLFMFGDDTEDTPLPDGQWPLLQAITWTHGGIQARMVQLALDGGALTLYLRQSAQSAPGDALEPECCSYI